MTFRAFCGPLWYRVGLCGPLCGWHVTNTPQHGPDVAPEPHRAAQDGILGQLGWLWPAERLTARRATSDPFRRLKNGRRQLDSRLLASSGLYQKMDPKKGPANRRATSDPFRRLGNGQVNGKRREKRDYTGALARGARAARGRQVRQARGNSTAYSVLTRGMAWGPRVVACET